MLDPKLKTVALALALSYLISLLRRSRNRVPSALQPIRPAPAHVRYALNILFVACALASVSTIPSLAPENVIKATSSKLQTPSDMLWERVASGLRPNHELTELDERLRNRLLTVEGRCLYLMHGPDTIGNCPFCSTDDPRSYFYYALPSILYPHLLNLAALGLSTSEAVAKREGNRFRAQAAVLGCILAMGDVSMFYTFDWKANKRVKTAEALTHFFWNMRLARGLCIAIADGVFALLLWATATNRLLVAPISATERLDRIARELEFTGGKLGAIGVLRNTTVRNKSLRAIEASYWNREGLVMDEVMAEKNVLDSVRAALESGRIDISRVEEDAKSYAEQIVRANGLEAEE